jgi:4-alpha-glucanotransferase
MLISPDDLVDQGLLNASDLSSPPTFNRRYVDYAAAGAWRSELLALAYDNFLAGNGREDAEFRAFCADNADWLDDYALFAALKAEHGQQAWWAWPRGEALSGRAALDRARHRLRSQIEEQQFRQWLFFRQWAALKAAANAQGIEIIGDIPIYAARDSADVWANFPLFDLDDEGQPMAVAGVPPDYFSATGQLWGNPLYRWGEHQATGFAWWSRRVKAALRLANNVRIDHFRAFWNYWRVPAGEPTAQHGKWMAEGYAPRNAFFEALEAAFKADDPNAELADFIVAEDLGDSMAEVIDWRTGTLHLPGMKIMQFAFGDNPEETNRFTPVPFAEGVERDNHIMYTGTHDINTVQGWWHHDLSAAQQQRVRHFAANWPHLDAAWNGLHPEWLLIEIGMSCNTQVFITPVQDVFGLGKSSRMNTPGVAGGNWRWRGEGEYLDPQRPEWQRMTALTARWGR